MENFAKEIPVTSFLKQVLKLKLKININKNKTKIEVAKITIFFSQIILKCTFKYYGKIILHKPMYSPKLQ